MPSATQLASVPIFTAGRGPPSLVHTSYLSTRTLTVSANPSIASLMPNPSMPLTSVESQGSCSLLTLPENIRKCILNLEYIDMAELRPETWMFEDDVSDKTIASLFKHKKEPVSVWIHCYAVIVSVLTERYPAYTKQFWAYLAIIVWSHRYFDGLGWTIYDSPFRRRAATQKNLNWDVLDMSVYNLLYTGRAKKSQ